jgi:NAD(P)-dependent dehydrogenase (short-subunit alcohol dehydrogenase family)
MPGTFPLPNASHDLTGDIALVTGASSGLGRRFALTFSAAGATVVVAARRTERLAELVEEIAASGGTAYAVAMDVTDADSIMAAYEEAVTKVGVPTILVNNAGIPDAQFATKMSVELIDAVIGTNLRGPYILACEFARRLMAENKSGAGKSGRIVNIASMAAYHYGGHGAALYSITKAAVVRMTEALAVEWAAFGINVNGIAPGMFSSEMMDGMLERMGDLAAGTRRKRIADPAQMDSTLLYLVSPASETVTGTVIKIDDAQGDR